MSSADYFSNNLYPDQAWQNVRPDLDPNCLTLWWYSWKNFLKNLFLKKISRRQKSMKYFPVGKELKTIYCLILGGKRRPCDETYTSYVCSHLTKPGTILTSWEKVILTLNTPITTKVVCFSRLLKYLRSLHGKWCGPRSDCSYREHSFLGPYCLLLYLIRQ